MRKQIRLLSLIGSSLLITSVSAAKTITVKDWSLDDSGASCVAYTNRNLNGQIYRLELSLDKSGVYPVEAFIREIPNTSTRAFRFITEVKPVQNFAFAPLKDAAGNLSFWQVPNDTASLVSYIKRQTRLLAQSLTPNGAAVPTAKNVDFSLRGSSDIVDALISQCNGGRALSTDFEKAFVPVQTANLDALKLDEEKSAELRGLYLTAVAANTQKSALQRELTILNTRYAQQIQELARLTGSLDQLTQKELAGLQNQKATIEARIRSLDQQIQNQQGLINAKEAEVVKANGIYDQAWKVIAPFEPEHKRHSDALQASRGDLDRAEDRIAELDNSIQTKQRTLTQYENEIPNLRNQLSQVESQLRNTQTMVNDTDYALRRFESYRERDERVMYHPVVRYCRENRTNTCESLMHKIINEAESEVANIENRLRDNADYARNQMAQLSNQASEIDRKIRDYQQYEIPSLRNQISDLRSQRPALESSVIRLRDEVNAKTAALQSYDQSVGYAEKKADLTAKQTVVVKLQGELRSLEQTKATAVATRDQQVRDLAATDRGIQDTLTKIRAGQDRSSQLNQALVPYFAEKSRIEGGITQADDMIRANKAQFSQIVSN